ncbi:recombinase family protein [Streptomyces hokutonensis]|uniref:recombinase family protein n=1 Tax=Streptomyces hokutonensis TaxID=1306990 RepID=UPI0033CC73C1
MRMATSALSSTEGSGVARSLSASFLSVSPGRRAKGQAKSRLEPDGARARTVTKTAHRHLHDGLGYAAIVARLNTDPVLHPPPVPPGGSARARGTWGESSVADLLRNPEYTGCQVSNRRASPSRSGAHNDPRPMDVVTATGAHGPSTPSTSIRRRTAPTSCVGWCGMPAIGACSAATASVWNVTQFPTSGVDFPAHPFRTPRLRSRGPIPGEAACDCNGVPWCRTGRGAGSHRRPGVPPTEGWKR